MARFQQILVPIDFDRTSTDALEYAVELAAKLGAHVTVLHVLQAPPYDPQVPEDSAQTDGSLVMEAKRNLSAAVRRARRHGSTISELLRQGLPWEEIQLASVDIGADLIVMGTHGRRGIARLLLGSVAQSVVQTSAVPVLMVRGG